MIKIEKVLLFVIVLILFVGIVSATETMQEDQLNTYETVAGDTITVSHVNQKIINNEENNLFDENPTKKTDENKTHHIEKKTKDSNLKKESIIDVHNYTELQDAVNNASSAGSSGVNTTIHLLNGSYNNTGTISWWINNTVLTIDGNGQTINGHQQQVFLISANTSMILKNIIITNATGEQGGAISNFGILNVTDSTFTNNKANEGGGIRNEGILNIINSTFTNNTAVTGGAINDKTDDNWTNIISSNFIANTANQGAAIQARGWVNLTNNIFKENTATNVKETIELFGYWNGIFKDNTYESTDIALNEIKLTVNSNQNTPKSVELNYAIKPVNSHYYKDFETGINDITLYIDGEKYNTTKYENITLTNLPAGKHEAYFTTCNRQSNTVTFNIMGDSQITTPEESYEYYVGINNKIPLIITGASGEKGNITITVKDHDEYKILSAYYNIGDNYQLQTESLVSALENLYNPLNDSYTINVTYINECTNSSSTEFTLNINRQRNTTIIYDILNNTEGNVQINITVQDTIYQTPITDANIQITGDITQNTTTGIITDNTLTPGEYTINVKYPETEDYKESTATINFTVEIDKDKKITELEDKIENLTQQIEELTKPTKTKLTIKPITEAKYDDTILITGELVDAEGRAVQGSITLNINGKNITVETDKTGKYQYEYTITKMADVNVTAVYEGTEKFTPANASTTVAVGKQDTSVIFDDLESINYGDKVNITGQLVDGNGKGFYGTVKLLINTGRATVKTDTLGYFTYTATLSKVGVNNITGSYNESAKYNAGNGTTTITVTPLGTGIVFDELVTAKSGETVTITGKLTDDNGKPVVGTIKLLLNNGRATVKTDNEGVFTYDYVFTKVGINNITASYLGATRYSESTASITIEITPMDTILTLDTIKDAKKGETITISGKLVDKKGNPIVGSIKLTINGARATVKTGKNGVFTYNYTVTKVGTNNITAAYLGANRYSAGNATTTVKVNKAGTKIILNSIGTVTQKTNVDIKGQLNDEYGNGIYGTVKLLINNGRATVKTDKTGAFTYSHNATRAGENTITANYLVSNNYEASETTTTFTVVKA